MELTRLFALAQVRLAALRSEDGQGTVEYAFLIVGVVLLAGLVASFIVPQVSSMFSNIPWP